MCWDNPNALLGHGYQKQDGKLRDSQPSKDSRNQNIHFSIREMHTKTVPLPFTKRS
jgi:hypothetical protein